MAPGVVFAADHVTKRFGAQVAVDDLTFHIRTGVIAALLGPNGAGKTTTIRLMLGLVRPSRGAASVFGRPYLDLDRPSTQVGAVLGPEGFHPARSGRRHLQIAATATGVDAARVDRVLELVDLQDKASARVGSYSLGMRQRLALAEALLGDPQALVLDEPGNGLDPAGFRWLRGFLKQLRSEGRTILISSHLLGEVAEVADEVVVIDRGRLVAHGSVAEVTARKRGVRVRTDDPVRLRRALIARGASAEAAGDELFVTGLDADEVGRIAAGAGCVVLRLEEVRQALEEAFFELLGSGSPP